MQLKKGDVCRMIHTVAQSQLVSLVRVNQFDKELSWTDESVNPAKMSSSRSCNN